MIYKGLKHYEYFRRVSGFVPFDVFCRSLESLKKKDFDTIYSAHDHCSLPKSHIDLMLWQIRDCFMSNYKIYDNPVFGTLADTSYGDMYTKHYFDMAVRPCKINLGV